MGQAPGFFGKVRSHGDFVGRRLPPDVRDCFDRWLQAALLRSREDLGADWLPTWLTSPLWRFLVAAGICGEQAWAGVMMPSHDRVGRCFPLLLMAGIDGTPSLRDCMTVHDGWFGRLERLALSTLSDVFTLENFDAALASAGGVWPVGSLFHGDKGPMSVRECDNTKRLIAALVDEQPPALASISLEGRSAWWSEGSPQIAPHLAICRGLPSPLAFSALLDGDWEKHGWKGSS